MCRQECLDKFAEFQKECPCYEETTTESWTTTGPEATDYPETTVTSGTVTTEESKCISFP